MSDDVLRRQVSETAALLRTKKGRVATQSRDGVEIPASELIAINKLEMRLANMESVLRLNELTREPVEEVEDEGS